MYTSRLTWQTLKSRPAILSAVAVAGACSYHGSRSFLTQVYAESIETPPIFGSFGPKTLRLQSTEQVNHNTKRLVFQFPDGNSKSGLTLTSKFGLCIFICPGSLTVSSCPSHIFMATRPVAPGSPSIYTYQRSW